MIDAQSSSIPMPASSTTKKKGHVRVFVRHPRHRLSSSIFRRAKANEFEEFTDMVKNAIPKQRKSSRTTQNTIVINYKPVFMNHRSAKSKSTPIEPAPPPPPPTPAVVPKAPPIVKPVSNPSSSVPFNVPEVEDPFMFIEQMYQQLFTEDGQLRQGTEPNVLANCMKQIVNHSRRSSMVRRDSMASSIYPRKSSTSFSWLHPLKSNQACSLSSSSHILSNTFSEEDEEDDEEPQTIVHKHQSHSESRRRMSNRRSSNEMSEHHRRQDFQRFLDQSRRTSMNTNPSKRVSMDDTENDELDPLSDCHPFSKTKRSSPGVSMDGDTTHFESKLLSSSGYQSMKSQSFPVCPNCVQPVEPPVVPSVNLFSTAAHLIQRLHVPIRDLLVKYLQLLLISKNILLVPLLIFVLKQRTVPIGHLH